jgi:NADH-quinone oxidoreductase subunit J
MSMFATAAQLAPIAAPDTAGATTGNFLPPVLILLMCAVAGVGTVMLLPSRRETPLRKIGGAVVLVAALIFAALLVRAAALRGGTGLTIYFWIFSAIALLGALRVVTHTRPVYSALYFVLTVFATAGLFILLWAEFMAAALVLIYAGAILVTYVFVIMLAASSAAPADDTGAARAEEGTVGGNGATNGDAHAPAGTPSPLMGLADYDAVSREPLVASAVGFVLMGLLLFVVFDRAGETIRPANRDPATGRVVEQGLLATEAPGPNNPTAAPVGETQRLGVYLFENHLVNLELAGLLLTVSMVGAIVIARRRIYVPAREAERAGGRLGADVFTAPMTPIDDDPHSIPVYGTDNPRQKAYPET